MRCAAGPALATSHALGLLPSASLFAQAQLEGSITDGLTRRHLLNKVHEMFVILAL